VLVAYIDESFDRERYRIAALVVSEARMRVLSDALDDVVERAAAAYGVSPRAELHGHELFHGKGGWASMARTPRARIAVYRDALRASARFSEAVFVQGVGRRGFRDAGYPERGYHEHTSALSFLMAHLDKYAASQTEVMMVVADECDVEQLAQDDLWKAQRSGGWGYDPRVISQIVDTVHFVPSKSSRLVQAVDMIAFLNRRIHDARETDRRAAAANAALWNEIAQKVALDDLWLP